MRRITIELTDQQERDLEALCCIPDGPAIAAADEHTGLHAERERLGLTMDDQVERIIKALEVLHQAIMRRE